MHPPDSPDQKNFIRDFGGHLSIAMIAMFTLGTHAQIYSRSPGSTGGRFFGLYFFAALLLEGLYYQIKSTMLGQVDTIAIEKAIGLSLMWFCIHGILRALRESRGEQIHSHDPGWGIFSGLYPGLPLWLSTAMSDVTITIGIALMYHVNASPIQRDFFVWLVLPSIVISRAWIQSRQTFIRARFVDATAEAAHYADTIGRG